jgi:hypothetical protein
MSERPVDPLEPADLAGLEDLAPDDPRVSGRGPRTRAQLRAYHDFVTPGEIPDGARVDEAEERLGRVLERELGVPLTGPSGPAAMPVPPITPSAPARDGFWSWLLGPRMRPALALGALLIGFGGVWLVRSGRQAETPVMRGAETPASPTDLASVSVTRDDGSVRLEWLAAPRADRYTVVFLSPDLSEIARVSELHTTSVDLRAGALPAGLTSGASVLWRVHAMNGNDEIARSRTTSISVP